MVYSSQLDSFREAVSNALGENRRQVVLTLSPQRIVIEDWGMEYSQNVLTRGTKKRRLEVHLRALSRG